MLFDIMTRPGDTPKSQLSFEPSELLCIGSPVGALATIDPHFGRGMRSTRAENDGARDGSTSLAKDGAFTFDAQWESTKEDLHRKCRICNIFHPNDPVAYRIEPHMSLNYIRRVEAAIATLKSSEEVTFIDYNKDDGNGLHHVMPSFTLSGGLQNQAVPTDVKPLPPVLLPTVDGVDNLHVRKR